MTADEGAGGGDGEETQPRGAVERPGQAGGNAHQRECPVTLLL